MEDVRAAARRPAVLEGRYLIEGVLARGGMSTVYQGLDLRLGRRVAVKVMEPRLAADPAFRARFEREARAAARLPHPGIVAVHDAGVDPDGTVFLVLELVVGGTLRDVLREYGRLAPPVALAVLEPVLSALAAAHCAGLVHRDVKPENVLISSGGVVKVADFGLVRAAAEASTTAEGVLLGTAAYLAPEQVATGAADARSDVYAAGVVLYEMLTGAPPFTGDTALSVAYRHVNDDVPAPAVRVPGLPAPLDSLVVRATRRDPAARPSDAGEFLTELRRIRTQLRIAPVPVPVPVPPAGTPTVPAAAASRPGVAHTRAITGGSRIPEPPARPAPAPLPELARLGTHARRRGRRLVVVWVLLVLLLAAAVAAAGWMLGS